MKFVSDSTVTLVQSNASDDMVAMAAWVSNGLDTEERLGDSKKVEGLINFLYREKHMSPFEHGQFTFKVHTPIFVAREFMRHRTFSYNEVSGRYKELDPVFYLPPRERPIVQKGKIGNYSFEPDTGRAEIARLNTRRAYESAWEQYQNMLDFGIAKEVARNVLPVGIMTEFYATVNPRNLMQFLDLRNAPQALQEIRDVAAEMEIHLSQQMPLTYRAYVHAR